MQSSPAIVLRWRSYGESDKIVTLLTREFGKLTGIAKGAKNSRRRFVNSLEPLARVTVYFRLRPGASLAFLERCELQRPTEALVEPAKFAYASYLVELTDQLTMEEHAVREIYGLLDEALSELECGPASGPFLRSFELQLLGRAGFEPQVEHCHGCRASLQREPSAFVEVATGVFFCGVCRGAGVAVAAVAPGVLPLVQRLKDVPLADSRQLAFGDLSREAASLTGHLLSLHLVRPLRSLRLIDQLAAGAVRAVETAGSGSAPA